MPVQDRSFLKKTLGPSLIGLIVVLVAVMGNRLVQTQLGKNALDDTGLVMLSLEDALSEAQGSRKWVLADMSAIWCATCRQLDQQVFANDKVKRVIDQDFVFARIEYDSEAGAAFMQKYSVQGFPTLLVLDMDGKKLVQLPITFEPDVFVKQLQQLVAKHHNR
jgi:thiol:disulfide interchange protein